MKKVVILCIAIISIPFFSTSQNIKDVDYISPFHDGVSAIKKDNQWAFINAEGTIVVGFRDDLVSTKSKEGNYPIFYDNRCLVKQKKEGIPYYGYIDKSGKVVIEPQFLNAVNFKKGHAIVLELVKVDLGETRSLDKKVYRYKYFEVIIDVSGSSKKYLTDAVYIGLTPENLIKPPVITSQFISENLVASKAKNKSWSITKID